MWPTVTVRGPTEAAPHPPLHYELHHPDVTPTVVLHKKKIRPPAIKFARPEPVETMWWRTSKPTQTLTSSVALTGEMVGVLWARGTTTSNKHIDVFRPRGGCRADL